MNSLRSNWRIALGNQLEDISEGGTVRGIPFGGLTNLYEKEFEATVLPRILFFDFNSLPRVSFSCG